MLCPKCLGLELTFLLNLAFLTQIVLFQSKKKLDGSKATMDQVKGIESFSFFDIQVFKANVLLGSILLTYSWLEVLLKLTK